jgi:3-hydroxybutyryl-CoA dehydrogenase
MEDIRKVGVVGCGIMGSGIAQVCAQFAYDVVVVEINEEALKKGLYSIASNLDRLVEKGKLSESERILILSRIKGSTDYESLRDCHIVIEAVPEELELKKEVFRRLDNICPPEVILATNTSVLSVTEIASATRKPENVLGMHFANPVPIQKIVEIVCTLATKKETLEKAKRFAESIGKRVIVAKDAPGFITNRLFTPFLLNAVRILEAGIATREEIDFAMEAIGHRMGPLATIDLIGLDTLLKGATAMYEELKDPQYAPPPLLRRMVALGWLGRKTGKGFYEYK